MKGASFRCSLIPHWFEGTSDTSSKSNENLIHLFQKIYKIATTNPSRIWLDHNGF